MLFISNLETHQIHIQCEKIRGKIQGRKIPNEFKSSKRKFSKEYKKKSKHNIFVYALYDKLATDSMDIKTDIKAVLDSLDSLDSGFHKDHLKRVINLITGGKSPYFISVLTPSEVIFREGFGPLSTSARDLADSTYGLIRENKEFLCKFGDFVRNCQLHQDQQESSLGTIVSDVVTTALPNVELNKYLEQIFNINYKILHDSFNITLAVKDSNSYVRDYIGARSREIANPVPPEADPGIILAGSSELASAGGNILGTCCHHINNHKPHYIVGFMVLVFTGLGIKKLVGAHISRSITSNSDLYQQKLEIEYRSMFQAKLAEAEAEAKKNSSEAVLANLASYLPYVALLFSVLVICYILYLRYKSNQDKSNKK